MNDENDTKRDHWKERSKAWTATAAKGKSSDDTLNQLLIKNMGIKPGERVLDIGSGTGDPAISIGLTLDGVGSITASDLTPEMLVTARTRAVNLRLKEINFAASDMTVLGFSDNKFDCVTCRFGLMFPKDRIAAAAEALRVLKPGGRVGYMVWGPYNENPPFFFIRRAVAATMGENEGPISQRHCLSAPGSLIKILDTAGFTRTEEREVRYMRPVDDLDNYINRALIRGYSDEIEGLDKQAQENLMDTLHKAFEPYRKDGKVFMPNYARLGIGWNRN
ncbi:MAG: class I SAM-dependent methyltransferase [Pseudomonadota bacterium]|nr:class I SAM-dependent methyltransferase [Pseudomonadota bacterium]